MMRMGTSVVGSALALGIVLAAPAVAGVHVKQAIADAMTPEELAEYTARLEAQATVAGLPADICDAATHEVSTLPFTPASDTTVGATDNYDLPPDTTNPTCTAAVTCTGAGPAGSLPRGAIYTGTGTAPDRAYRLAVDQNCTLSITATPESAWDLALFVYQSTCSSNLADCACVDDTGVNGVAETITLDAVAGTDYFILIDGYSTGATPPGPSGPFHISVTETTATGCALVDPTPTTTVTTTSSSSSTSSSTSTEAPTTTTLGGGSTTTLGGASTTTTTTPGGGSTTTTLPGLDDCGDVPVDASFESIACRLAGAMARMTGIPDHSPKAGEALGQAQAFAQAAADLCAEPNLKKARKNLSKAARKVKRYAKLLAKDPAIDEALKAEMGAEAAALVADLKTRKRELVCPDDAL
jgi:hypothetical protein